MDEQGKGKAGPHAESAESAETRSPKVPYSCPDCGAFVRYINPHAPEAYFTCGRVWFSDTQKLSCGSDHTCRMNVDAQRSEWGKRMIRELESLKLCVSAPSA